VILLSPEITRLSGVRKCKKNQKVEVEDDWNRKRPRRGWVWQCADFTELKRGRDGMARTPDIPYLSYYIHIFYNHSIVS